MKLEEAIDRNVEVKGQLTREGRLAKAKAVQLGIEALKFRLRWEQQEGEADFPLLPGETKD